MDVETTGLGRTDRVVEIAIVTLDINGKPQETFHTLVNPHRDVGPTAIHGVTPSMVARAPAFADIADAVAERLDGAVVAAHNIAFDTRMIGYELRRVGINVDWGFGLDTLSVTNRKLLHACRDHGVELTDAHQASADATATAQLLVAVAKQLTRSTRPAAVHAPRRGTAPRLLPRGDSTNVVAFAPVVALSRDIEPTPDVAPYMVLLDQALADLKLTVDEQAALRELADDIGLTSSDVHRAHRDFLTTLIDNALDDDVVTDDELDMLTRVAALLELDPHMVTTRTNHHRMQTSQLVLDQELAVCFTGDADTPQRVLTRQELHAIATDHGLRTVDSVTASGCHLLVAVDTATTSGKAIKAHKFGIPIASVDGFLEAVATRQPLQVVTLSTAGVGCVCTHCGDSWTATRRAQLCPACRGRQHFTPTPARPGPKHTVLPAVDTLTCIECHATWERPRVRGRRPHRCPACAAAA
ncbi:exonuclease domain-containing protein [Williamsia deligens]|uniref:Exonuclease domain-containing protein n=1 Tax=Williamsia deligens TaxID=321325 RepID=A0ABW3G5A0_9NOCA|nr:exonuclease domain-containing protein [Williamsia deligens]